MVADQSSLSVTVRGHCCRAGPGTPQPWHPPALGTPQPWDLPTPGTPHPWDPPGLELPQLPTGIQLLSEGGESSDFGCKCCIFSGSISLPRHGNFRMFHHGAAGRKAFSACSGTTIQVQGVSSVLWTEILSEYRLPEPSTAQALDFFFESAAFFCPVQL